MRESARRFGRHGALLGIVSELGERSVRSPAVVILNAGIIHRVGPNRSSVSAARSLARAGHRVLRFDLSGVGDSGLPENETDLRATVRRDILDAVDEVTADGQVEEVVLMGLGSGADNALAVADDERVRGLVLIDPWVHPTPGFHVRKVWSRLTRLETWGALLTGRFLLRAPGRRRSVASHPPEYFGLLTSPVAEARDRAGRLRERGVRLLYVITGGIHHRCNHPGQVRASLGGVLDGTGLLEVEWWPETDHTLSERRYRKRLSSRVRRFLDGMQPSDGERGEASSQRPEPRLPASNVV